jgi:subtilase family serine protease
MSREFQCVTLRLLAPLLLLAANLSQAQVPSQPTRRLITQSVDDNRRVTLTGNVRPEVNSKNDRGPVPDSFRMDHLQLTLRLPEEKRHELEQYLKDLQDPHSPSYHQWLTPQRFKDEFALASQDVQIIIGWLKSAGFTVGGVSPTVIDFSGSARQVERSFRIQLHYLDVNGVKHIANITNPQIPAALAPAVSGIVALNDFQPHPLDQPDHGREARQKP